MGETIKTCTATAAALALALAPIGMWGCSAQEGQPVPDAGQVRQDVRNGMTTQDSGSAGQEAQGTMPFEVGGNRFEIGKVSAGELASAIGGSFDVTISQPLQGEEFDEDVEDEDVEDDEASLEEVDDEEAAALADLPVGPDVPDASAATEEPAAAEPQEYPQATADTMNGGSPVMGQLDDDATNLPAMSPEDMGGQMVEPGGIAEVSVRGKREDGRTWRFTATVSNDTSGTAPLSECTVSDVNLTLAEEGGIASLPGETIPVGESGEPLDTSDPAPSAPMPALSVDGVSIGGSVDDALKAFPDPFSESYLEDGTLSSFEAYAGSACTIALLFDGGRISTIMCGSSAYSGMDSAADASRSFSEEHAAARAAEVREWDGGIELDGHALTLGATTLGAVDDLYPWTFDLSAQQIGPGENLNASASQPESAGILKVDAYNGGGETVSARDCKVGALSVDFTGEAGKPPLVRPGVSGTPIDSIDQASLISLMGKPVRRDGNIYEYDGAHGYAAMMFEFGADGKLVSWEFHDMSMDGME